MDRRTFLTAAMAAGIPLRASTGPIQIAFLGCSYSHAKGKLGVLAKSSEFKLAGIHEPDPELQAQYRKKGIRMLSQDEVLGSKEIEVVAVESDPVDHARMGMMVLEAGKHLHLEKPPALDVASLRAVLDLAREKSRLVQIGYMWRHHPGFRAIFDAVHNGWLGDVYMVEARMNKSFKPERRKEWEIYRGGQMFELCSHVIDQVVRLMGRPDRITPFLRKDGKFNDDLVDNTTAVFEFPNALGLVIGSALCPNGNHYRSFVVSGTEGVASMSSIEPPMLEFDLHKPAGPYKKGIQQVELAPYERFEADFHELAAAIRDGKPLSVTPHEDMMVQESLIAASEM